jgi:hypothetical protein
MSFRTLFTSFLILFLLAEYPAFSSDRSSKARIVNTVSPSTSDEKAVLNTVQKIYKFSGRDFICVWEAKRTKGDFVAKFRPYFSDEIVEAFFKDNKACEVVGAARYGFVPLDDPSTWTDQQYKLVRIESAEVVGDKATVEVRFWSVLEKGKNPLDQDHGGTIISLIRTEKQWKVSNLESTWMLGGEGFHSLIDGHPSAVDGDWKNMDYKNSLKRPRPF